LIFAQGALVGLYHPGKATAPAIWRPAVVSYDQPPVSAKVPAGCRGGRNGPVAETL